MVFLSSICLKSLPLLQGVRLIPQLYVGSLARKKKKTTTKGTASHAANPAA